MAKDISQGFIGAARAAKAAAEQEAALKKHFRDLIDVLSNVPETDGISISIRMGYPASMGGKDRPCLDRVKTDPAQMGFLTILITDERKISEIEYERVAFEEEAREFVSLAELYGPIQQVLVVCVDQRLLNANRADAVVLRETRSCSNHGYGEKRPSILHIEESHAKIHSMKKIPGIIDAWIAKHAPGLVPVIEGRLKAVPPAPQPPATAGRRRRGLFNI